MNKNFGFIIVFFLAANTIVYSNETNKLIIPLAELSAPSVPCLKNQKDECQKQTSYTKKAYRPLYSSDDAYEQLESYTPVTEKVVVINEEAKNMVFTNTKISTKDLTIPKRIEEAAKSIYKTCEDTFQSKNAFVKYTCFIATIGVLIL